MRYGKRGCLGGGLSGEGKMIIRLSMLLKKINVGFCDLSDMHQIGEDGWSWRCNKEVNRLD